MKYTIVPIKFDGLFDQIREDLAYDVDAESPEDAAIGAGACHVYLDGRIVN